LLGGAPDKGLDRGAVWPAWRLHAREGTELLRAQRLTRGEQEMKLWYVSRDGKRRAYADPRTGSTEWTRTLGEEVGEQVPKQPGNSAGRAGGRDRGRSLVAAEAVSCGTASTEEHAQPAVLHLEPDQCPMAEAPRPAPAPQRDHLARPHPLLQVVQKSRARL